MEPLATMEGHDIVIRAPRPEPFQNPCTLVCPACRNRIPTWMRILRWMLELSAYTTCHIVYCPGGKPPSEALEGLEAAFVGGVRTFSCAGLAQPHLHCHCSRCSYQWLMATECRR